MNPILEKIMMRIPASEVIVRRLLERSKRKEMLKKRMTKHVSVEKTVSLADFCQTLQNTEIQKGDIVIVHSSMDGMSCLDAAPAQILAALKELVGIEGTVVFPVFPSDLDKDEGGNTVYDIQKSMICTGLLPFVFTKTKGTVRSRFPFNSLAANGKYADEMMKEELNSDLAHGRKSSWGFCINKHAKVLYLGIHVWQADTLLHAAEDYLDEQWPIKDWYLKRDYVIKNGNVQIAEAAVRFRDGRWHKYFASYHSGYVLKKNGLIQSHDCGKLIMETIPDAFQFNEFVMNRARVGKTFYYVPQKFKRKI